MGLAAVSAAPAVAGDGDEEQVGVHSVRADDAVVVYGDLFARWNGTRWFIATEVQLPGPQMWRADLNDEVRIGAYQVRAVLACDKEWKLFGRKYEVRCRIEDVGIQAASVDPKYKHTEKILQEFDAKLSGASVQLQVKDNGRVVNIDLEGVPNPRNQRERQNAETLRQLLSRLVVGFDMKLRKANYLSTGQWVEYRSALLSMPSSTLTPASGTVVHQLNGYNGHTVVQTKGQGQMMITGDNGDGSGDITFTLKLNGVSIYDDDEGFMTERVWSLAAERTAGSFDRWDAGAGAYAHSGVLRMLGEKERAPVGPTREVVLPGFNNPLSRAAWEPVRPASD